MKRKCSEYNEPVKKKIKCRCCLKRIPDITEAYELTDKINRQFYKLTNLKVNELHMLLQNML